MTTKDLERKIYQWATDGHPIMKDGMLNGDKFEKLIAIVSTLLSQRDEEIRGMITKKRQEIWRFYHEAQLWKEQKEAVKPYDEILSHLPSKFEEKKEE